MPSACASTSASTRIEHVPFRKLRSLKDAEEASWYDRADPRLIPAIRRLWAFSFRLAPRHFPPGVRKFRTIEEKNRHDDAQRRANVEAHQRRLRRGQGPEAGARDWSDDGG
jgi:hypothetical protein